MWQSHDTFPSIELFQCSEVIALLSWDDVVNKPTNIGFQPIKKKLIKLVYLELLWSKLQILLSFGFFLKDSFLFLYMCFYPCVYLPFVCRYSWRPEKDIGSSELELQVVKRMLETKLVGRIANILTLSHLSSLNIIFKSVLIFFQERVSLCSLGWPWTHRHPPASASTVYYHTCVFCVFLWFDFFLNSSISKEDGITSVIYFGSLNVCLYCIVSGIWSLLFL